MDSRKQKNEKNIIAKFRVIKEEDWIKFKLGNSN